MSEIDAMVIAWIAVKAAVQSCGDQRSKIDDDFILNEKWSLLLAQSQIPMLVIDYLHFTLTIQDQKKIPPYTKY